MAMIAKPANASTSMIRARLGDLKIIYSASSGCCTKALCCLPANTGTAVFCVDVSPGKGSTTKPYSRMRMGGQASPATIPHRKSKRSGGV
jgi:hypothetical protein